MPSFFFRCFQSHILNVIGHPDLSSFFVPSNETSMTNHPRNAGPLTIKASPEKQAIALGGYVGTMPKLVYVPTKGLLEFIELVNTSTIEDGIWTHGNNVRVTYSKGSEYIEVILASTSADDVRTEPGKFPIKDIPRQTNPTGEQQ